MKPYRVEKVAGLIKDEISEIIQRKVYDPRINFVSIQYVELSKDLRNAKIHFTIFGDEQTRQQAFDALNKARGFIRAELAKRVFMRFLPNLEFILEQSIVNI
ncbi:MAG: ribosome-binding factor A [Candidatus Fischerbacteria bacterium RBG_13_37_8]|uniref:Ribosome-binding factor A n=1 Tax=Candidatus Fischerbacteria bacterium RBG_13_37_8 TaxID=1817863 RepID=A0A1F5VEF0_9BACT|nr:MAG: ribosome-binding factor A [Candidatus Fischerbacteria bacterium RBG_13_37_8]